MGYDESPWVFKGRCGGVVSRHTRQTYQEALNVEQIGDRLPCWLAGRYTSCSSSK